MFRYIFAIERETDEPVTFGPYRSEQDRIEAAKELKTNYSSLYRLNTSGPPVVRVFLNSEIE